MCLSEEKKKRRKKKETNIPTSFPSKRNNTRERQTGMQMFDAVHSWNDANVTIMVTSCWHQGDIQIENPDVK